MTDRQRFCMIEPVLPQRVSQAVKRAVFSGETIEEIRLRENLPVAVTVKGKSLYLSGDGGFSSAVSPTSVLCSKDMMRSAFLSLCENSVFAHEDEIKNGFISFAGGFRAGVCGEFSGGTFSRITSINIRISREITGCAEGIAGYFVGGMLIAGPPGSGKTTVLRDLIRILSSSGKRICVIDSRREISGGRVSFNLGPGTDVYFMSDKAAGAQMALRTMFPNIIAFDEVGTLDETDSILEAFHSGVDIITTAHAGTLCELKSRPVTKQLIDSRVISSIAMLGNIPGGEIRIYETGEITGEDNI